MAVTLVGASPSFGNTFKSTWSVENLDINYLTSNRDSLVIPTDAAGANPVFTEANVIFTVVNRDNNVNEDWTISSYSTTDVTITVSDSTKTVSVTAIADDLGHFVIQATKAGEETLYRKISVYKAASNGNFTYTAYASDDVGTNFNFTYNEAIHSYQGILVNPTTSSPVVGDFAGLWVPLQKTYTYVGYSSDDSGSSFSEFYVGGVHHYTATYVTEVEDRTITASNFTGRWVAIRSYNITRYASDSSGTDFSNTYDINTHSFEATIEKVNSTPPVVGDFAGLWVPLQKTYTYVGYAEDSSGTAFNETYIPGAHYYTATYVTEVEDRSITASNFTGRWEPIRSYTYTYYASDASGSDYSSTYSVGLHSFEATLTKVAAVPPIVGDFAGLWVPLQKTYTYVGYADFDDGDGFTSTFSTDKLYFAILSTTSEVVTPVQADFNGLWQLLKSKNLLYDYSAPGELIEPNGLGNYHPNTMGGAYNGPAAYYYKGTYERIYFAILERYTNSIGAPISGGETTHRIGFVDLKTNIISNIVEIPFAANQSTDTHTVPSIIVTDTGRVIVMFEQLNGTPVGTHNSPIEIWRSDAAETIEDPGSPGTHYFTQTATISGLHSYPKIFKLSDNTIYAVTRRNGGADHRYVSVFRSLNDGVNWVNLSGTANTYTDIVNYDRGGGPSDWYSYTYGCFSDSSKGINLVLAVNEGPNGTSPDGTAANSNNKVLYFLHSDDGETWMDAKNYLSGSGGGSKDITIGGPLTHSELEANYYKVDDVSTDVDYGFAVLDVALSDDLGIPYLLYMTLDRVNSVTVAQKCNRAVNYNIMYFNATTDTWVIKDIIDDVQLGSDDIYGRNFTIGAFGSIDVYTSDIIDIGISRPKFRYYNDPNKVTISTTAGIADGKKYLVTATDPNNFGTGVVVNDIIVITDIAGAGHTLNGTNTLEPLLVDNVIFRTYNGGDVWSIIYEDADPRNIGYAGPWRSASSGSKDNYNIKFLPLTRPYDGSSAANRMDFKIIIGKKL